MTAVTALHSSLPDLAKRLSEAAAVLAAMLYVLGVMRITGELRELHLSTPTILAGFAHADVLMKGVGVLASQLSSTLVMLGALTLFASQSALGGLNRLLLDERALRRSELAVAAAVGVALVLAARFWEGAAYVLLVALLLGWLEWRNRRATRAMAMGVVLAGVLFTGVFGSYLHAPPLMHAEVAREGQPLLRGLLVGKGTDGELYVATERGDGYRLEIVGGVSEEATRVTIDPADDRAYRTLFFQIEDHFS